MPGGVILVGCVCGCLCVCVCVYLRCVAASVCVCACVSMCVTHSTSKGRVRYRNRSGCTSGEPLCLVPREGASGLGLPDAPHSSLGSVAPHYRCSLHLCHHRDPGEEVPDSASGAYGSPGSPGELSPADKALWPPSMPGSPDPLNASCNL